MASADLTLGVVLKPVGSLLSTIFKVARTIRMTVERMKINEANCRQLSQRVDMIVSFLPNKLPEDLLSEPMERAFRSFAEFLDECLALIKEFADANYLERIWYNKDFCREFARMDEQLSRFTTDLSFGMGFTRLPAVQSSRDAVEQNTQRHSQSTAFNSGIWTYKRCINEIWQDTFNCELIIDTNTKKIRGSGEDNFGHFGIDGLFSQTPLLIEMVWTYRDHLQIINLQWNVDRQMLCGIVLRKSKVTDKVCQNLGKFEMNLFVALSP
ncbi:unnamed protein product [Adineta steineri]|uniref:Mixed lineage kinase domain-containing protein n=1 Tax=Adineta steineri TaxID=433720 RepID=A0A813Z2U6_9BILA|nr:unnamed protein product [Adineta steineri]CAF0892937.1 unnamed protein product [Adineta steineri]CAF3948403.1 unnamed protein product [Adineta steineri]CAF4096681.1 unnamed protein product [Adineta steineri]